MFKKTNIYIEKMKTDYFQVVRSRVIFIFLTHKYSFSLARNMYYSYHLKQAEGVLHILVLWIPGNLIHSPLKGQGAARCPQAAGGLTRTPGLLGKGPHPSSSGLLTRPSATATGPRRPAVPPSPPYSQKFPQTPPFPQKSYAVWLAITSDWHSWLFTTRRESFPTGGHKLLEGRDQVLASLVFSRQPSRAFCAQHTLTNAWWTMNKEFTCEVFLTATALTLRTKEGPQRLVRGLFLSFSASPQSMLDTAPQLGTEPTPRTGAQS